MRRIKLIQFESISCYWTHHPLDANETVCWWMRFAKSMAAEDNMDVTPPSPEIGDSRKRPLDDSSDNGSTKRSHFSGESKHFRKKKPKNQKNPWLLMCVLSLSFIITYFEFVPRKWEMRKWEIRDRVARKRFLMNFRRMFDGPFSVF